MAIAKWEVEIKVVVVRGNVTVKTHSGKGTKGK
ncbi:uncharacterized protein G2W53_043281 [Senna tora]|uniref:Uncharacterized protein n=1 Tax=Senna tora TaxID=362788 RepID=A0A834W0H2_9FABA|nr:uncharacterized protein G2W53_043281 [Senna tora]